MIPISINIQKAGALEEKIKGCSSKNIQYLQLVGFINESDIEVIDSLKELTILDISNAQIVVDGTQNDIIGDRMFSGCCFSSITLPNDIRSIGKQAFYDCKKIAAIYCKGLPPQIDETFFENIDISNCKLYAESCYLNDYKNDRYWKLFIKEEKKVESKSTYYTINECLTPITMFDDFFKRHQNEFIYQKGRKQYDDLYDKIRKASKLKELCRMSIQYGVAPNAEDFKIVAMFGSTWFGFNQKLTRMGALIALKIWDETVNMEKQLASDIALYNKAQSIIRITS